MSENTPTGKGSGALQLVGPLSFKGKPTFDLHTNIGVFLWHGREGSENKSFIMGMPSYMKRLRNAEAAIGQDDPYADRMYYLTEKAIDQAQERLTQMKADLTEISNSITSRFVFPDTDVQGAQIFEVEHRSALGYRSIELLILADECCRIAMEAAHKGRFGVDEKRAVMDNISHAFRSIFHDAGRWKYTGVTRDDIAANNSVAREAYKKLGKCESEFLRAEKRSKFAPDLPQKREQVVRKLKPAEGQKEAS